MRPERLEPGEGQESVWDYPRPPRLVPSSDRVRVVVGELTLADSTGSVRVLETSHPPVYYIPPNDVDRQRLVPSSHTSFCEWKGYARYHSIVLADRTIDNAAWSYPDARGRFASIAGYYAFYPSRVDACFVGDEQVDAQAGDFYGGWITSNVVGPFKGPPGTRRW